MIDNFFLFFLPEIELSQFQKLLPGPLANRFDPSAMCRSQDAFIEFRFSALAIAFAAI
jgi:hypothetical protein